MLSLAFPLRWPVKLWVVLGGICRPIGRFLGSASRLPWSKHADVLVELASEALYQGVRSGMALLPITKYFCEANNACKGSTRQMIHAGERRHQFFILDHFSRRLGSTVHTR